MAPILKKYRATIGASGSEKEYFFLQSPTSYEGSLDTVTGVKAAADSEQDEPNISVASLLRSGKLHRVVIRYTSGTGFKTAKLLVARDKLGTALDQLVDKTFRGGTIKKASIPQKVQFF